MLCSRFCLPCSEGLAAAVALCSGDLAWQRGGLSACARIGRPVPAASCRCACISKPIQPNCYSIPPAVTDNPDAVLARCADVAVEEGALVQPNLAMRVAVLLQQPLASPNEQDQDALTCLKVCMHAVPLIDTPWQARR
jgi:hypothetical protein